jgi:hypothetical protein
MAVDPRQISSDEYNERVAWWGTATGMKIRGAIKSLSSKGKGELLRSFRNKTAKFYGEIDKISYVFERHGVFWHKGVGRAHMMTGGVVVRGYKPGKVLTAYALAKNRVAKPMIVKGAINRKPVEWFNPIVEDNIEKLANMVAEMRADQAVNATKILIK